MNKNIGIWDLEENMYRINIGNFMWKIIYKYCKI